MAGTSLKKTIRKKERRAVSDVFPPVGLDEETVKGAVKALLARHASEHAPEDAGDISGPLRLITINDRVSLQYRLQAAPAKQRLMPKRAELSYGIHSEDAKVCLFVKDPSDSVRSELDDGGIPAGIQLTILGLKELKREYKSHERRRALSKEHDVFLADSRIAPSLPGVLGSWFAKSKQLPITVDLARATRSELERALRCTAVHIPMGNSASVHVGHTGQPLKELIANVLSVGARCGQLLGGEVLGVYLTAARVPALPIYVGEAQPLSESAGDKVDDIDSVLAQYEREMAPADE